MLEVQKEKDIRVLLLGSGGFLGKSISKTLNATSGVILFTENALTRPFFEFHSSEHRKVLLKQCDPDVVIQAIWLTKGNYVNNPQQWRFSKSTIDFYTECHNSGVRKFIAFGTGLEVNHEESLESAHPNFDSSYLLAKVLTRKTLFGLEKFNTPRVSWIQIYQLYGKGQPSEKFLPSSVLKLRNSDEVYIDSPNSCNDWVFVDDVSELVAQQCLSNRGGVHQAGTGIGKTNFEIIDALRSLTDSQSKIRLNVKNRRQFRYVAPRPHSLIHTHIDEGLKKTFLT